MTWSLEQSGRKMEGGGWAAVQTWVRAAEAETNDLEIVSAEDARPGDIVTYDWGDQEDFGADGHIGFLASNVEGGKFTALEGNNQDAVMNVPRATDQANVKFIRIGGSGAPAATPPAPRAPVLAARPPRRPPSRPAAAEAPPRPPMRPPAPRRSGRSTRATTPHASRSPPGWPSRPRTAGFRRSCRSWPRSSSPA